MNSNYINDSDPHVDECDNDDDGDDDVYGDDNAYDVVAELGSGHLLVD